MTSLDDLPFFGHITEAKKIKSGTEGTVYRLRTDPVIPFQLCAKVMTTSSDVTDKFRLSQIGREALMNQKLYEAGISVPRPVGLFYLHLPSYSSPVPGFVREYVDGRSYSELFLWQKKEAELLHAEEREKAIREGFYPRDCGYYNNCLYTVRKMRVERVTLFDFTEWRM